MTVSSVSTAGVVPEWTVGDKLRKARKRAGLSAEQLAEIIGVSRNTVSNYEEDKVKQRKAVKIAWALCTGVPYEWIDPTDPTEPLNDTGVSRPTNPCLSVVAGTVSSWETRAPRVTAASTAA